MHALIENNTVVEYPITNIRQKLSNYSLPSDLTKDEALPPGYVYVNTEDIPQYNPNKQKLVEDTPVLLNNKWVRKYLVINLTSEELDTIAINNTYQRELSLREAYQQEADPLFFKAQRGEATMEEWLAKVAEIKSRYTIY